MKRRDFLKGLAALLPLGAVAATAKTAEPPEELPSTTRWRNGLTERQQAVYEEILGSNRAAEKRMQAYARYAKLSAIHIDKS